MAGLKNRTVLTVAVAVVLLVAGGAIGIVIAGSDSEKKPTDPGAGSDSGEKPTDPGASDPQNETLVVEQSVEQGDYKLTVNDLDCLEYSCLMNLELENISDEDGYFPDGCGWIPNPEDYLLRVRSDDGPLKAVSAQRPDDEPLSCTQAIVPFPIGDAAESSLRFDLPKDTRLIKELIISSGGRADSIVLDQLYIPQDITEGDQALKPGETFSWRRYTSLNYNRAYEGSLSDFTCEKGICSVSQLITYKKQTPDLHWGEHTYDCGNGYVRHNVTLSLLYSLENADNLEMVGEDVERRRITLETSGQPCAGKKRVEFQPDETIRLERNFELPAGASAEYIKITHDEVFEDDLTRYMRVSH